ncbi:MAG TPA: ribosomal-protein-alanine N-acetyltransferase [Armatimonadetes bacterium]|nr:ribosomal-protein-alanine N-acetyltransferase [Armatimonadota bacterium]
MAVRKAEPRLVPVTIERMQLEDIDHVVELDKKCFPIPWSASAYVTEAHNPSAYYIVARANSGLAGYAGMWLIMDEAHITTIGVDPGYRGCKVGERMLINLMQHAISQGATRATLEVRKRNLVAQNLYTKYGFQIVAVRKGYYTNNNEDALVMWTNNMDQPDYLRLLTQNTAQLGVQL